MTEPLYVQIKHALVELINRGEYEVGKPFVTQRAVCTRFGVSNTTAVRALNELVSEGLLVRRQGSGTFVAERKAAPPPRKDGGGAPTIAVVLQRHSPYVGAILDAVSAECDRLGYHTLLMHCYDSREREAAALRRAMESGVSGILLYPTEDGVDPRLLAEVQAHNIPLVMVDRYQPDVATDAVVADNVAIGYEVTRELIERGHTRIATLWGETECTSVRDRLSGHVRALHEGGIPLRPELTVMRPYIEPTNLRHHRSVVEGFLATPEPPTVLLCANGFALARAAADLAALGVHVPGDIDLAGMDDAGPFDVLPLTVVAAKLPGTQIGTEATALIHERITSGVPYGEARHVILPIGTVTREEAPGHLSVVAR